MRPGKNVHIDSYPRAIFAIVNGIASATNWLKGAQSNEYMIVGQKIMDRQIPKGFLRSTQFVQRNITYLQCTEEEMSGKGGQFEILSHVNFGSLSWTGLV
jgi:hypothetical protein